MKRLALVCCVLVSIEARAQEVSWVDQFGTGGFDTAGPVATDIDYVYTAGRVGFVQALPGQVNMGGLDAYVKKYDGDGNEEWTRQFGTPNGDLARDLAVYDGDVYVAGISNGVFPGELSVGGVDVFIRKYDAVGNDVWTSQFGTSGFDASLGLTVVPTGIYVFGTTTGEFSGETAVGGWDLFLAKLDSSGNLLWVRQFGTAGDDPAIFLLGGLAADETGVYVGSSVTFALPGQTSFGDTDAILRKYDHDGNEVWTSQFGTACLDLLSAVEVGPDGLYITGSTTGDMTDPFFARCSKPPVPNRNFGSATKTYVRALTVEGTELWTQQDGHGDESELFSLAIDLAVDESGVYVAGEVVRPTPKTIDPACAVVPPSEDIRIRAYDLVGSVRWTQTFGTTDTDVPQGIAIHDSDLIVGGVTNCALLGQTSSGSRDAFVMKVEVDP
jgi:hypothetical protein